VYDVAESVLLFSPDCYRACWFIDCELGQVVVLEMSFSHTEVVHASGNARGDGQSGLLWGNGGQAVQ
jgi:hypothetical protein